MIADHMLQISVTEATKRQFEAAAAKLHLTPEAFLTYLLERQHAGVNSARLDAMVREVFGQHGEVMRRLAK